MARLPVRAADQRGSTMRKWFRWLLLVEVAVCFAPAGAMLIIGIMMVPFQIFALVYEPLLWDGPLLLIGMVASSIAGLWALVYVMTRLIRNDGPIEQPVPVLVGIALGLSGPSYLIALGLSEPSFFAIPDEAMVEIPWLLVLACSAHLIFLSRRLFFPRLKECARDLIRRGLRPALAVLGAVMLALIASRPLWHVDLAERHDAWLRNRPDSYAFDLHIAGGEKPDLLYPRRIRVRADKVTSAVYTYPRLPGETTVYPPPAESAWTMNDIFDHLIDAQARGGRVRALFDARWGFVKRADIRFGSSDKGWELTVRDFESLSGQRDADVARGAEPMPETH
jgi:hypothetical protein